MYIVRVLGSSWMRETLSQSSPWVAYIFSQAYNVLGWVEVRDSKSTMRLTSSLPKSWILYLDWWGIVTRSRPCISHPFVEVLRLFRLRDSDLKLLGPLQPLCLSLVSCCRSYDCRRIFAYNCTLVFKGTHTRLNKHTL